MEQSMLKTSSENISVYPNLGEQGQKGKKELLKRLG